MQITNIENADQQHFRSYKKESHITKFYTYISFLGQQIRQWNIENTISKYKVTAEAVRQNKNKNLYGHFGIHHN